jgi:hypothetical protein
VKRRDTDGLTKEKQEEKYEVRGTLKKTPDRRGPEQSKVKL